MHHRLDQALARWGQSLAERIDETLTVGRVESRLINESELTRLSEQSFLVCSFRNEGHPDGDWQVMLSVEEAELIGRLPKISLPDLSVARVLEETCEDWLATQLGEFLSHERPRFLGVNQQRPGFRSNLKAEVVVPLLVEGEVFLEVRAILEPSLYETLRRPQTTTPTEHRESRASSVFAPLHRGGGGEAARCDMGVILDVPLELTVVLGCTSVMLEDLISLGEGSVMELDKLAGEPVELYVKDRLVGLAEVVVSDERFAVRILEMFETPRRHRLGAVTGAA